MNTRTTFALSCDGPVGDPAEGTPEWTQRDAANVACGNQKFTDADASPAFLAKYAEQQAIEALEFTTVTAPEWAAEPTRFHSPGAASAAKVADPFRSPEEWAAAGRGRHTKLYFINGLGAKLRARVFAPNDATKTYPVLAFSPGLQSFNEVNLWFPEEMAEAGYVVMIVDPQGQGDSELCGHAADGTPTSDCPSSSAAVYREALRSAIDFLLSTPSNPYAKSLEPNGAGTPAFNPYWASVDPEHVGIAGHSYGAIAATPLGQEDPRVDAIVSYDNLDARLSAATPRRAPTLFFATDYAFPATPTPKSANPDPDEHLATAYEQLIAAGVETMSITSRASDHYEWGVQPFPANFPSSRYGERVALYYSLAWFDRYLKGDASGTARLVSRSFDLTADRNSIGAGTYDPVRAAANPADPFAGNVPYKIAGKCAANLLSFYYHSAYWLEGGTLQTRNMRALGCGAVTSGKRATAIAAKAEILDVSPTAVHLRMKAVLSAVAPTQPLSGKKLTFSTPGGVVLCSAVSDATGTAACGTPVTYMRTIFNLGYIVKFAGDSAYAGSAATGALIQ